MDVKPVEPTVVITAPSTFSGTAAITIAGPSGASIRYRTDGGEAGLDSPIYTEPVVVDGSAVVHAVAVDARGAIVAGSTGVVRRLGTGAGWEGSYFPNISLSGTPVCVRTDAVLGGAWGSSGPAGAGVGTDRFSVRWRGLVTPWFSGRHTFTVTSDDGVALWIDDRLRVRRWNDHGTTVDRIDVDLVAGRPVPVEMEYYENGGSAIASLQWSGPWTATGPIPASQVSALGLAPRSTGTGLLARYHDGMALEGAPLLERIDPAVDAQWGGIPAPGVPADRFSVRWLGEVVPRASGDLTLSLTGDDGVQLWLDGRAVVSDWRDHGSITYPVTRPALAGVPMRLRVDLYDKSGGAVARLNWRLSGEPERAVEQVQLQPLVGFAASVPVSSRVSPASFHVLVHPDASLSASGARSVDRLNSTDAMVEVDLDPAAPAGVDLSAASASTGVMRVLSGAIVWDPTPIAGTATIRAGDRLLLAGGPALLTGPDGATRSLPAGPLPVAFDRAGVWTVADATGTLTVTAVGVALPTLLAGEIGTPQSITARVTPAETMVDWTASDPIDLTLSATVAGMGDWVLTATPRRSGSSRVVARLFPGGPVIRAQEFQEFTLNTVAAASLPFSVADRVGETVLTMEPLVPGVTLTASMFAHRATFRGGAKVMTATTDGATTSTGEPGFQVWTDPDTGARSGHLFFDIEAPAGETRYCFSLAAALGGTRISTTRNINGSMITLDDAGVDIAMDPDPDGGVLSGLVYRPRAAIAGSYYRIAYLPPWYDDQYGPWRWLHWLSPEIYGWLVPNGWYFFPPESHATDGSVPPSAWRGWGGARLIRFGSFFSVPGWTAPDWSYLFGDYRFVRRPDLPIAHGLGQLFPPGVPVPGQVVSNLSARPVNVAAYRLPDRTWHYTWSWAGRPTWIQPTVPGWWGAHLPSSILPVRAIGEAPGRTVVQVDPPQRGMSWTWGWVENQQAWYQRRMGWGDLTYGQDSRYNTRWLGNGGLDRQVVLADGSTRAAAAFAYAGPIHLGQSQQVQAQAWTHLDPWDINPWWGLSSWWNPYGWFGGYAWVVPLSSRGVLDAVVPPPTRVPMGEGEGLLAYDQPLQAQHGYVPSETLYTYDGFGARAVRRPSDVWYDTWYGARPVWWTAGSGLGGGPVDRIDQVWSPGLAQRVYLGQVEVPTDGDWTFAVPYDGDGGIRLRIGDAVVVDDLPQGAGWRAPRPSATRSPSGTIALRAGSTYPIALEHLNLSGTAAVQLRWQGPETAEEVVPRHYLYSNDRPVVRAGLQMYRLDGAPIPVREGSTISVQVVVNRPSHRALRVPVQLIGDGFPAPGLHLATVDLAPWAVNATIQAYLPRDGIYTGPRVVRVSIAPGPGYTPATDLSDPIELQERDPLPTPEFVSEASEVRPGGSVPVLHRVGITVPGGRAIPVPLATQVSATSQSATIAWSRDGHQPANADAVITTAFYPVADVVIPAGATIAWVTVSVADPDDVYEGDETFDLLMSGNRHTVTIRDDDPRPTVAWDPATATVREGATAALTARIRGRSSMQIILTPRLDPGSVSVLGHPIPVVAPADRDDRTVTIAVPTIDDTDYGPDRLGVVHLAAVGAAVTGPAAATVTVTDDDPSPSMILTGTVTVDETAGSILIPVTLARRSGLPATAAWSLVDGSAVAGLDATPAAGVVVIPPGATVGAIRLAIIDDDIREGTQRLTVRLADPVHAVIAEPGAADVVVLDDEPVVSVAWAQSAAMVREGATTAVVLGLSRRSDDPLSATVALVAGSASDQDAALLTSVVVIPAGAATASVVVAAPVDGWSEGPESAALSLVGGSAEPFPGVPASIPLHIEDADPLPQARFVPPSATVAEGVADLAAILVLDRPSAHPVELRLDRDGVDAALVDPVVILAAGATTATAVISVLDDRDAEPFETVIVRIVAASGAVAATDARFTLGILASDQGAAVVSIQSGPAQLGEGDADRIVLGIDRSVDADATVTILADAGLVLEPEVVVFTPSGPATRAVLVTNPDDQVDRGDRTLAVRILAGSGLISGDPSVWPIVILDNDLPTVSVQVAGRVVESATVVPVVVRIDRASLRPVVVSLSLGGTADEADASLSATQAVIAPGSTETVLWLTVAADGAVEPSETVVVLAEVVSGAQPQPASGLLRIVTDDLPAPVVAYQERTVSADGTLTVRWYVALPADSDIADLHVTGLPPGSAATEITGSLAVVTIQGRSADLAGQTASVSFSASGGTGPSASLTVQGDTGSDGDRDQVPLPPPTIRDLSITDGLTGDERGPFPGAGDPEAFFTNKASISCTVSVSVSFGTLGPVEVRLDGPSPAVAQGVSGTLTVGSEGIYTLTVTATAVDGDRQTVGVGNPVVLVVDRTGPVVAVSATAPLRTTLEGDRDLLFVNGADTTANTESRGWGLNCLAPSEAQDFLGFVASDGLSGISRTSDGRVATGRIQAEARNTYWRAQTPRGNRSGLSVDVPDPAAPDPVAIRLTKLDLPTSITEDGWVVKHVTNSRYKIALKVQDRCGNYATSKHPEAVFATDDESGGADAAAAPTGGYRDQFKVWVDTTKPKVRLAKQPYQEKDPVTLEDWNQEHTSLVVDVTHLRLVESSWDAAYVWQDSKAEANLARRAHRGPTDMPDLAEWTWDSPSWWVLPRPVSVGDAPEKGEVSLTVVAMDAAGNRSDQPQQPVRRDGPNSSTGLDLSHPLDGWHPEWEFDDEGTIIGDKGAWGYHDFTLKARYGVGDWILTSDEPTYHLRNQPLLTDRWIATARLAGVIVEDEPIPTETVTEDDLREYPLDRYATHAGNSIQLVLPWAADDEIVGPWEGMRRLDIAPVPTGDDADDRLEIARLLPLLEGETWDATGQRHWVPRLRKWTPGDGETDADGLRIRTFRKLVVNPHTPRREPVHQADAQAERRVTPGVITVPPSYAERVPDLNGPTTITVFDKAFADLNPSTARITLATHPASYFEAYFTTPEPWTSKKTTFPDADKRDYTEKNDSSPAWPSPGGAQEFVATVSGDTATFDLPMARVRTMAAGHARVFIEAGTDPVYELVAGWQFANVIRLAPDIVAAGSRVTVRIEAGFLDKAHPFSSIDKEGDWVRFKVNGTDVTIPKSGVEGASPESLRQKIAILDQRLIADGVNATIAQTMELDLLIGADVPADLADVEVQCGAVQKDGGGRHVMKKGMKIVLFQWVQPETPTDDAAASPVVDLPASAPASGLALDPIAAPEIAEDGSIRLTIRGTITDPLAAVESGHPPAFDPVTITVGQGPSVEAPVTEQAGAGQARWAPYRRSGRFDATVTMPRGAGVRAVWVETAANAVGRRTRILVAVDVQAKPISIPGVGPASGSLLVSAVRLDDARVAIWAGGFPMPADALILVHDPAHGGYSVVADGITYRLAAAWPAGSATQADVVTGTLTMAIEPPGIRLGTGTLNLMESGPASEQYSGTLSLGGSSGSPDGSAVRWSASVGPVTPVVAGRWNPIALRIDGVEPDEFGSLQVGAQTFETVEQDGVRYAAVNGTMALFGVQVDGSGGLICRMPAAGGVQIMALGADGLLEARATGMPDLAPARVASTGWEEIDLGVEQPLPSRPGPFAHVGVVAPAIAIDHGASRTTDQNTVVVSGTVIDPIQAVTETDDVVVLVNGVPARVDPPAGAGPHRLAKGVRRWSVEAPWTGTYNQIFATVRSPTGGSAWDRVLIVEGEVGGDLPATRGWSRVSRYRFGPSQGNEPLIGAAWKVFIQAGDGARRHVPVDLDAQGVVTRPIVVTRTDATYRVADLMKTVTDEESDGVLEISDLATDLWVVVEAPADQRVRWQPDPRVWERTGSGWRRRIEQAGVVIDPASVPSAVLAHDGSPATIPVEVEVRNLQAGPLALSTWSKTGAATAVDLGTIAPRPAKAGEVGGPTQPPTRLSGMAQVDQRGVHQLSLDEPADALGNPIVTQEDLRCYVAERDAPWSGTDLMDIRASGAGRSGDHEPIPNQPPKPVPAGSYVPVELAEGIDVSNQALHDFLRSHDLEIVASTRFISSQADDPVVLAIIGGSSPAGFSTGVLHHKEGSLFALAGVGVSESEEHLMIPAAKAIRANKANVQTGRSAVRDLPLQQAIIRNAEDIRRVVCDDTASLVEKVLGDHSVTQGKVRVLDLRYGDGELSKAFGSFFGSTMFELADTRAPFETMRKQSGWGPITSVNNQAPVIPMWTYQYLGFDRPSSKYRDSKRDGTPKYDLTPASLPDAMPRVRFETRSGDTVSAIAAEARAAGGIVIAMHGFNCGLGHPKTRTAGGIFQVDMDDGLDPNRLVVSYWPVLEQTLRDQQVIGAQVPVIHVWWSGSATDGSNVIWFPGAEYPAGAFFNLDMAIAHASGSFKLAPWLAFLTQEINAKITPGQTVPITILAESLGNRVGVSAMDRIRYDTDPKVIAQGARESLSETGSTPLRFISIHPALRQRQLRYASTTDGHEVPEQQSLDKVGLPSSPVSRNYPNSPLLTEMDILSSSDPDRSRTVMAYGMFDKAGIAFLLGARDNPDTTGLEDEGGEPMLGRVGLHGAAGDPLAASYGRRAGGVNIHGVQVGVQGDGFGPGVPGERDYWHVDLWGWSMPGHAFTSRRFYRDNCVTHPHRPRAPETGGNGWWFFDTTGAGYRAWISTSEDADNVVRITPDMVKRAWSKPRQLVEQGWVTP